MTPDLISPETKRRLSRLVKKFLNGTASPEEKEFIERYYQHFEQSEPISSGMSREEKAALEQRMLRRILDGAGNCHRRKKIRRLFVARAAAVISVLLVVFAAWRYLDHRSSHKARTAEAAALAGKDLLPGGNKAVLTLAGGETILLDAAAGSGQLARQGNTAIRKTREGELVYLPVAGDQEQARQQTQQQAPLYNSLSTPRGGTYRLVLPDGSKVWLNAETTLRYEAGFSGTERRVELSGEAYFEIAPDVLRPFKVLAGGKMEIEVTGTHFNVMAYTDEDNIETSLLEGAVTVRPGSPSEEEGFREAHLKPGQMASLKRENDRLVVQPADVNEAIAWQRGLFLFRSADVATILRAIGRWYDVEIVYQGEVPSGRISGKIPRSMNASHVLQVLELSGVKTKIEGGKIIVM